MKETFNINRAKHSRQVGLTALHLGRYEFSMHKRSEDMFTLGLLHDIGYQFGDINNHAKVGGEHLRRLKYKYWQEVYWHGTPNAPYQSRELFILNLADTTTLPDGTETDFEYRLQDIAHRYGKHSSYYIDAVGVVNELEFGLEHRRYKKHKCHSRKNQ